MTTHTLTSALCRWTARIVGTLLVILTVVLAIREGLPSPVMQPAWCQIIFLGLSLIMIGILIGWRRERTGGIVSLAGFGLSFVPMKYSAPCGLTWFYLAMALPGALYIASALLRRSKRKSPETNQSPGRMKSC